MAAAQFTEPLHAPVRTSTYMYVMSAAEGSALTTVKYRPMRFDTAPTLLKKAGT